MLARMTETNSPAPASRRPTGAPGVLTVVGVALLIWGLLVGFVPTDGCGSPFWPDDPTSPFADTASAATCAQAFGQDGTFAAALLIAGMLCIVAGVVVREVERMFFPALVPVRPSEEIVPAQAESVE